MAIDVTTPQKPVERGRYMTDGRPAHVVLANGLAYLTVWQKGLEILDMTDPSTPRRVGGIADPAISYFAADGKRGILGRWNSTTLDLYDLTDPKAPRLASSIETAEPGIAIDIRIRGDVAFVVGENSWDGVRALDLADIRAPRFLGHFDPQAGGGTIAFQDDIAYVSGWTEGTHVVDFTDPRAPVRVDRLDTPAVYADVAIDGDLALVANTSDGLRVLRISDHAITDLGATYTRGTFYGIAARNGYAFVGCEFEDFRVFQYSSGAPFEIASVPTPGIATRVVLDGDRAYIADGPGGLHLADISDPEHPRDLGAVATPGSAVDVAFGAGRAWVAAGEAGVRIIDPSLLREVGSIPATLARGVAMHDGELLVSDDHCVRRFSLDGLERRHWCRSGSMLARIATRGSRAYVADLAGLVYALDAKQLVLLGTVEVPSTPDAVVATPGSIFVAAEDAGILMLGDAASRRRAARH